MKFYCMLYLKSFIFELHYLLFFFIKGGPTNATILVLFWVGGYHADDEQ